MASNYSDFFGTDKSDAKLKAGVFEGPEIRKLMLNEESDSLLNPSELATWNALKSVVTNFLGNHHHDQNADIVDRMLKAYELVYVVKNAHSAFPLGFLSPHLGAK